MDLHSIDALLTFLDIEVSSAVTELGKVAESSRKHLQKLVYTNVLDRFDATIDHLLLDNVTFEPLLSESLVALKDHITEGETLRLLSSTIDVAGRIRERCEGVLRSGVLRERHSRKVRKVFEVLAPTENLNKPRVNINTGTILAQFKGNNTYHCDVAKTVKLKIGSITNAVEFFRSVAKLLKG